MSHAGTWRVAALAAIVCLVTATAVLLGDVRPVQAHGYIVRSIPQDQATVAHAPTRVQIWFSEALEPQFSTLAVYNQANQQIDLGGGGVAPTDLSRLTVRLPPNLPDGAYMAEFRAAFASDGHIVPDQIVFWVGHRTGGISQSGAGATTSLLEVVARALSMFGAFVIFGGLLLYSAVLRPAWFAPIHRAGGLAPRIMTALYRFISVAVGLALLGNVLWLLQQSMALFNTDLGSVLAQGSWAVVAVGTDFGDVWRVRIVLLIGVGALLGTAYWIGSRRPSWVFPLWLLSAALGGLTLGTFSLSAHAAGSTLWPLVSIGVDWLHLLGNAAWIGGLIVLVWTLRAALPPLDVEGKRLAMLAVLRRFSPLAVSAVTLMVATGAYSALAYVYTPAQMVNTGYGQTLGVKLLLVAPLLAIGWLHNRALLPGHFRQAERWITRTLRVEAVLGISVIGLAALLSATPPPTPPNADAAVTLPTYSATSGVFTLTVNLNPGTTGSNSYDARLTSSAQPVEGARVTVEFVYPALGKRSTRIELDAEGDGSYSGAGSELDQVGNWQALFDVWPPDPRSIPLRFALIWNVAPNITPSASRQPTVLNWLSLLGVVGILGVWLIPIGRQRLRILNFDPLTAMIAVAALVLTAVVLVGGGLYLQTVNAATEAATNPPPVHVNTELPNQASLDAGLSLYVTNCASCHAAPNASISSGYVASHRDSDLYDLHYSTAHPYGAGLTDAERWALVNYLRAFAERGDLSTLAMF